MSSFVHSLFEHHLALLFESISLSYHVKVRSATVQQERESLEMLLQSQSTPIRNRSSASHSGRNPVSSRHQTSILTKQEATEMWTIAAPYASNRAPMKGALMSPSTAPPLRSSKWSSRRFNPTIRPRPETPRSTITTTTLNPSFFYFCPGDLFTTTPSWRNSYDPCASWSLELTPRTLPERERGH